MDKRRIVRLAVAAVLLIGMLLSKKRHVQPAAFVTDEVMVLGALRLLRCPAEQQRAGGATYCATFSVPERWDEPSGRKLDLRVQVVRSEAQVAEPDLVVLLAGGPGQAATESFDGIAASFEPLLKHRHVLLLDQRGTGGSHPLECAKDEDESAGLDLERVRAQTKSCLAELEKTSDVRQYATTPAVQDLEALRVQLGSPQLDLVGISYGTRVAQQYLAHHADGVRSSVLDGVVPNDQALAERTAPDFESALKRQLGLCSGDPICKKRFGDPYATLYRVRDSLRAHPQQVTFRDPFTFVERTRSFGELDLVGVVRLFAYTTETAALLPLAIDEAAHGRYATLLSQGALVEGQLDGLDKGMALSVECTETADLFATRPEDAQLLLGDALVSTMNEECKIWPHGVLPADFRAPVHSDKPVLLLSGELDPATPPENAERVLRELSNARHLVVKGQGHNAFVRGCMPRLVSDFVDALQPKRLDAACLDTLGALPAFTGFDGASP